VSAEEAGWRGLRLRTGDPLLLVNVARGGALVDSFRRLLPGTTVLLQVTTEERSLTFRARVVRCWVHALGSDGVLYRGALAFAESGPKWVSFGEAPTEK
jgi:hypothetical protein